MNNILIMLGAPGSGKGTQAHLLSQRLSVPMFDVGYLLRQKANDDPEMQKMMSSGNLLSDDFINGFVNTILVDVKTNFIIDGYPRTLQQAIFLDALLSGHSFKVIKLEVKEESLIARLSSRVSCFLCGKIYNDTVDICEKCHVKLNKRSDDSLEVIKRRLQKYKEQEARLVNFYGQNVVIIDGEVSIDVITKKILVELGF